ncbi:MAG: ArsR/SmtB family transcription factor [Bdellovibrionota bacterium]
MEIFEACEAFSSLSQETRLKVFRMLMEYGRDGTSPGKIAEELGIPDNTLSFHLSHMSKAGLVTSRKSGRTITYFANTGQMNGLVSFLLKNCCAKESRSRRKGKGC